ncbi:MAG: thiamine pyrophosphate-binding protein [Bacteroides sp.]|nr:thiamine pyrophosphate-binding protein [Bacteroides sp.]
MKVKVSDFVAQFLYEQGVRYNFSVTGGGAMHLNVSLGNQKGMINIYVQHEQAAAIAAEGFYRVNNELPLVCCTTGPGGTNALTGVLGAWLDSIPMLVISGQVKYPATVRSTGYAMRIFGDQEFDITKAVAPMTKYAEMVTDVRMIKYHLQKALYFAKSGRPGPSWIDIPLDIQWGYVDTDDLLDYNSVTDKNTEPGKVSDKVLDLILEKLKTAKRPVLYTGIEIRTNGAYEAFLPLMRKLNIPVVTSFDSIDLVAEDDPLYAGRAGDVGNRYGNWAVQNSDFLLVVGSRLGIRQVSYATETWARAAFVAQVYPDSLELTKPNVHVELPIRADIREFVEALDGKIATPLACPSEWLNICHQWKRDYPVVTERHYQTGSQANVYCLMNELSKRLKEGAVIVSANGSPCAVGGNAFLIKKNQRFIINSGCASMGYDLPAAIGACFATGKKDIYCLAGDGSIQMNLQELQTIVFHKLPVKILVINNRGYQSIRQSQRNLLKEYAMSGVGPDSGDLGFPDMEKIAAAYGIPYVALHDNKEVQTGLASFLDKEGYALCEVFVDTEQPFEPKPSAMKREDGSLFSPPLEDLAPFLPREELKKIMLIPLVGEDD